MTERENDPNDTRLRDAFTRLRARDAAMRPSFHELRARPRPRLSRPLWLVAVPLVAAAAVLFAVCGFHDPDPTATATLAPPRAPEPAPRGSTPYAGPVLPLDFLLDPRAPGASDTLGFLALVPTAAPQGVPR